MKVTLPNGVVMKGVPDGTSKQVIRDKAIAAGVITAAEFEPPPPAPPAPPVGTDLPPAIGNEQITGLPEKPSLYDQFKHQLGRTTRIGAEAVGALPLMAADAGVALRNYAMDSNYQLPSNMYREALDSIGLPRPEGALETGVDIAGQVIAGGIINPTPSITKPVVDLYKSTPSTIGPVTAKGTALALREGTEAVATRQSPTKQAIGQHLQQGSDDISTAGYKLNSPGFKPETATGQRLGLGNPTIVSDPLGKEALKQGFDKGFVASVKAASAATKKKMKVMVNIMQKGKNSASFSARHRPADVAGEALKSRFDVIYKANFDARNKLDVVAKTLKKHQYTDFTPVNTFVGRLKDMGITVTDDLQLTFKGSDIEGLKGPQKVIKNLWVRMRDTKVENAHDAHRLKKFIDENVTYGKSKGGLTGKTEVHIKELRHNINQALQDISPDYKAVNTTYSKTREVMDEFQEVMGRKIQLGGPNADKALGQEVRKLLTNYEKRIRMMDSFENIEKVIQKYGTDQKLLPGKGEGSDDLFMLSQFMNELERVFGHVAQGAFGAPVHQGTVGAANAATSKAGAASEGVKILGKAAEKMAGVNEEAAFKAISELLK